MRRLLFTVLLLCVLAARGEEHPVPLDAAWTLPDGARLTPAGTLEIQIRPGKEANRFLTAPGSSGPAWPLLPIPGSGWFLPMELSRSSRNGRKPSHCRKGRLLREYSG